MIKRINDTEATNLYYDGLNDRQIGECLGVTRDAVSKWRKRRGFESMRSVEDVLSGYVPEEPESVYNDPETLYANIDFLEKEIVRKPIRRNVT